MLCYFVLSLSIRTVSIGDIAYNSPWYRMNRNERIIVRMIIRRSQRPCQLKGLGIFVCSLETYLRVIIRHDHLYYIDCGIFILMYSNDVGADFQLIRSAVSYYMVFRQLNTES